MTLAGFLESILGGAAVHRFGDCAILNKALAAGGFEAEPPKPSADIGPT